MKSEQDKIPFLALHCLWECDFTAMFSTKGDFRFIFSSTPLQLEQNTNPLYSEKALAIQFNTKQTGRHFICMLPQDTCQWVEAAWED